MTLLPEQNIFQTPGRGVPLLDSFTDAQNTGLLFFQHVGAEEIKQEKKAAGASFVKNAFS